MNSALPVPHVAPTARDADRALATQRLMFWLLIALAWFATLAWRPLLEPDEGRYAEIPREMWVSGDWVTPRLDGVKYFEKPALQYWATAAMYSLFGVREWTSRFWPCALAFLCIPLTYAFARQLYGSTAVAGAAAAALALNPYFVIVGQLNLLDSALTFFLVAAMFAFLRARNVEVGSKAERRWMLVTSLALALAVLSKGVVALALAGATLFIHMAVTREVRPLRQWHLSATVPLFLVVTVPWFAAVSLRNPEFLRFFFIHEHLDRYLTNEADRVAPWWFFLPFVLLAVLPWIRQAVSAMRAAVSHSTPVGSFLLIWCAVVLAFFSISHSKLPPYVMPMMPALAVLLAPRIAERPESIRQAAWITCALVVSAATLLVIAGLRRVDPGHTSTDIWPVPAASLTPLFLWAAIGAGAVVLAVLGSSTARMCALAPAAFGSILGFQALLMSYSALPPVRTSKALVAAIKPLVGADTQLFSVDQYRQSVPPYLGRTLRLVRYRGELDFGLTQDASHFVPTLEAFIAAWSHTRNALAFVNPEVMNDLKSRGVPFRVRAVDGRSVVVSRE